MHQQGFWIEDSDTNKFLGNFVGVDVTGSVDLGNSTQGIRFRDNSSENIIGDGTPGGRNVISGNNNTGLYFEATQTLRYKNI